jgi:hypothetical protein
LAVQRIIAIQRVRAATEVCSREAKKLCSECSRPFCEMHILR